MINSYTTFNMNDEVLKHLLNTGNKLYQLQQQWIQYVCSMYRFASTMGEERHINLSSIGRYQMQNRRWHSILRILHELKEQVCQQNSEYDRLETFTQLLETEMETLKNELSTIFLIWLTLCMQAISTSQILSLRLLHLGPIAPHASKRGIGWKELSTVYHRTSRKNTSCSDNTPMLSVKHLIVT